MNTNLDKIFFGPAAVRRRYCCQDRCFPFPRVLALVDACCAVCNDKNYCVCNCINFQTNKWREMRTKCQRCWNRHIEECGCKGKSAVPPEENENSEYCCDLFCCVIPQNKKDYILCADCENVDYCVCGCVRYRLDTHNGDTSMVRGETYEVVEIKRKFVDPPLFYDPLHLVPKQRYKPFYSMILKFRKKGDSTVYTRVIPPEITFGGFMLAGTVNPSYDVIHKCAKYVKYCNTYDFLFYNDSTRNLLEFDSDNEDEDVGGTLEIFDDIAEMFIRRGW